MITIRKGLTLVGTLRLDRSPLRIGRTADADIVLDHPSVSRTHAELVRTRDAWRIADAGSTNGVIVNGERTTAANLRPGDVVEIRPFTLTYGDEQSANRSLILADSSQITQIGKRAQPPQVLVRQRLEDLYTLARLVLRRADAGALWPTIQHTLRRTLHAERCVIIGINENNAPFRLYPPARPGFDEKLGISQSVLRDVIEHREPVLVERVASDAAYAEAVSLAGTGVGSVLCVPVVIQNRVRAVVYAERQQTVDPFRVEDLSFVSAALDLAAAAVELDELQDQARELAHVRGRLAAAREIQEMLLPRPLPQPPWGRLAAHNFPADTMSGDIYDAALADDGSLVLMLADVAGKGVPAALITATLQSTLRISLLEPLDLAAIVQRLNRALESHHREGLFATMFLARWSPDGQAVEVANCGHHAPLWLRRDGTVEEFPDRIGMALGIDSEWHGEVARIDTRPYRAMTVFSDGVIEARNPKLEDFGAERARQAFEQAARTLRGDEAISQFAQAVRTFCRPGEPEDDVTILWLERES
jgi:sigma-B regulation protein RsbU (phosphoserine phosphatase)